MKATRSSGFHSIWRTMHLGERKEACANLFSHGRSLLDILCKEALHFVGVCCFLIKRRKRGIEEGVCCQKRRQSFFDKNLATSFDSFVESLHIIAETQEIDFEKLSTLLMRKERRKTHVASLSSMVAESAFMAQSKGKAKQWNTSIQKHCVRDVYSVWTLEVEAFSLASSLKVFILGCVWTLKHYTSVFSLKSLIDQHFTGFQEKRLSSFGWAEQRNVPCGPSTTDLTFSFLFVGWAVIHGIEGTEEQFPLFLLRPTYSILALFPSGRRQSSYNALVSPGMLRNSLIKSWNFIIMNANGLCNLITVGTVLLCQFEPKSVLRFLESFENYRLEYCLRLCQDYGVTDAAAFLLERVGDVASALSLTISDVSERIQEMDSAVASIYEKSTSSISSEDKQLNVLLMMPEVDVVHAILVAAVSLCQRNTLRLDPQESETLWFRLLDKFSQPSRELYSHEKSLKDGKEIYKKSQKEGLNLKASLRWKVINVSNSAYQLRRVFAHFIGEIIEGMMGYVPLPIIMSKLLSDNGSQEFGDFKATILGLLGTYGYERTILDTAKNLIEDDAYYNINMLRKGASHAYAPANSCCCICGRTLDRESFGSSIYIFHCGHAAHFQCETQDTIAIAKDSMGGCPICLPKKRSSPARRKMIEAQKEIVKEARNSIQNQASSSKNMNETALMERPFGLHHQSRFELLNNLVKGQKSLDLGLLPNLRLAPPLVYHDHKAHSSSPARKEETSNVKMKIAHPVRAQRTKGSSPFQFPLTSSIFGNDKNKKR
ncbi:hypothetical protein KI387_016696 [Taxus chinensis]|uniref:RING-type domain-containing protein n=1 Tax=Taxus chinensis TaxID=29808 RepID=A0AA38LIC6_TAXCH|nr:hypothetical protein KI387_016696 [Taxus chinensis]